MNALDCHYGREKNHDSFSFLVTDLDVLPLQSEKEMKTPSCVHLDSSFPELRCVFYTKISLQVRVDSQ